MNERLLVVAPHADDETLGCGGLIHKARARGDQVHWLLVTGMSTANGYAAERVAARDATIERVAAHLGVAPPTRLDFPPAALDSVPTGRLVAAIGDTVQALQATTLYLPFPGDAHGDHRAVFAAAAATGKWFRHPSVRRVCCYETASETGFGLDPGSAPFRPNWYEDISAHLDAKLDTFALYSDEAGEFPFPRSATALASQARVRGSESGYAAAEAYMLLSARND